MTPINKFVKNNSPSVLIVILNYQTYDMSLKLIEKLTITLEYDNYSVIVVDNCSPNESAKILKEKSRELGYIFYANKKNAGYAAGNNIGIRYGIEHGYAYSWILNNDVELRDAGVLKHMVDAAEKDDRIACVGPKIYSSDDSLCAPYCRRPTLWSMTLGIFAEKRYRQKYDHVSREVYRVYGCCMLLRNKAMAEVDCMDERTFLYCEEPILAERMLSKGYRSYYDAEVGITHLGGATIRKATKTKRSQMEENRKSLDFYLKEYRGFSFPARWLCHFVSSIKLAWPG